MSRSNLNETGAKRVIKRYIVISAGGLNLGVFWVVGQPLGCGQEHGLQEVLEALDVGAVDQGKVLGSGVGRQRSGPSCCHQPMTKPRMPMEIGIP